MTGQAERFRRALAVAPPPIKTQADVARAAGVEPGTLRAQIARDSIPDEYAEPYARVLRVTPEWLMFNRGPGPAPSKPAEPEPPQAPKSVPRDPVERAALLVQKINAVQKLDAGSQAKITSIIASFLREEEL